MPDINDIVVARVRATFCGQPVMNSFGFQAVVPFGTFSDLGNELTAELEAAVGVLSVGGQWVTGLNVQYKVDGVDVIDVLPGTSPLYAISSAAVGTVTDDDALPPNDSLCATLRSAFKGPGGRGRVYLTGFSEGAQNGGFWEAGTQLYADTLMSNLNAAFGEFGTGSFRWTIIHRNSGGAPITPESKPVMSWTIHNEVRSIGRRSIGRRIRRRTTP